MVPPGCTCVGEARRPAQPQDERARVPTGPPAHGAPTVIAVAHPRGAQGPVGQSDDENSDRGDIHSTQRCRCSEHAPQARALSVRCLTAAEDGHSDLSFLAQGGCVEGTPWWPVLPENRRAVGGHVAPGVVGGQLTRAGGPPCCVLPAWSPAARRANAAHAGPTGRWPSAARSQGGSHPSHGRSGPRDQAGHVMGHAGHQPHQSTRETAQEQDG